MKPSMSAKAITEIPVLQIEELIISGELVTVQPISREPLTRKRLEMTYNQAGKLIDPTQQDPDWYRTALAPFQRVYAVGLTPEKAIRALAKKVGWGRVQGFEEQPCDEDGGWFYRFRSGDGTSMKAGGRFVPGGVLIDWWV